MNEDAASRSVADVQPARHSRLPPPYFDEIRSEAAETWVTLESNPHLAGPWKHLFSQVQSPRHVLSELLQNADDADAKRAWAFIADGHFIFEHDGQDFDEDQLASLCRFGFSNKRNLHTIGFRGVGFKSTFSLGDTVEVLTPTLALRFHKHRFTAPTWIDDAPFSTVTRITVRIQDHRRERDLKKNLGEWRASPASLLFFNSICELTIEGVSLRKQVMGPGPIAVSERVRLTGCGDHDLPIFRSPEERFPDEAISETQQERDTEDLHLPPCRVELVVGIPGEQRLYVVLPTGVSVKLPFSCNAPFLQDPARTAIKAPSISPTNRWLLRRLGDLAGSALLDWLRSEALDLKARAGAYSLFPKKEAEDDTLSADATSAICEGFAEAIGEAALLLTTEGLLVKKAECIAPVSETYAVWTPNEMLEVFGDGQKHALVQMVTEESRRRLESWGLLDGPDADALVKRLASGRRVPRPATHERLLRLWCLVHKAVRYDYDGSQRRRLALVPVEGSEVLVPANDVVRLSSKKETIGDESWSFLAGLVRVIDRQWVEYLSKAPPGDANIELGRQLLRDLNLEGPSDVNKVVASACRSLFAESDVALQECVQMAHVLAALNAQTPETFLCATRDGKRRRPGDGVIAALDPGMENLLPPEWSDSHVLHDDYFLESASCTRQEWQKWAVSPKSGFMPFPAISEKVTYYMRREEVELLIKSRHGAPPGSYPYKREFFRFYDYDLDEVLLKHWQEKAKEASRTWMQVLERIVQAPEWYWKDRTYAKLTQLGNSNERDVSCGPIPSDWIARFSALPCLPDTQGTPRAPAELYLRTPATEPLLAVEPFVRAELDTEATKPLLRLLGVRDTSAGLDKLLARIRALARAPNPIPLLHEITKWYGALDRVLARCDSDGLEEARRAFREEPLILTASGEWVTSAEVFQSAGEDELPDAPVVHPSVQYFAAWARLGVADRLSAELLLGWLSTLGSGQALDQATVRRVRSVLHRYPVQVWERRRHWLALDNTWTPVDELRFRLTMRGLTKWGDLFPAVKSRTANLQMLSAEVCDRQPFSALPDLGARVEYRLAETPRELRPPVEKPWLSALARELQRVKLSDDAETERVRGVAVRLGRSRWQPFTTIGVTPYLDGTPAGQLHSPEVLWHEETLFVRDGRLAKSFDALVSELARPFANEPIAEAIKVCIERDERFIAEYMAEHFKLEAGLVIQPASAAKPAKPFEDGVVPPGDEKKTMSESVPAAVEGGVQSPPAEEPADAGTPEEDVDAERDADEIYTAPRRSRQVPLFERFAVASGYRWDQARQRFVHADGSWIERCESPFHWRRFDAAGDVTTRYWASQQCLTTGVEIAAELWELVRGNPGGCCLILVDGDDRPMELSGQALIRMVEDRVVTLYPAKYRIREDSKT